MGGNRCNESQVTQLLNRDFLLALELLVPNHDLHSAVDSISEIFEDAIPGFIG